MRERTKIISQGNLNIGFWYARVERGSFLANRLNHVGADVTIYHSEKILPGQYRIKRVDYSFLIGLKILFQTNHDIYFTTGLLKPALQLMVFKILRKKDFVLGVGAPYWKTYNSNHILPLRILYHKLIYPILFNLILRSSKHIVTNSKFLQQQMRNRYYRERKKIINVYNGVNYTNFSAKNNNSFLDPAGALKLITVGTANFKEKTDGIILLINSISEYMQDHPNTVYSVVLKSDNENELSAIV